MQRVVEYQEETRSHEALTYDHTGAIGTWTKGALPPGQALRQPSPLFKRLDESVIEEEYARLEAQLGTKHQQESILRAGVVSLALLDWRGERQIGRVAFSTCLTDSGARGIV
jgi:hypothetical protein